MSGWDAVPDNAQPKTATGWDAVPESKPSEGNTPMVSKQPKKKGPWDSTSSDDDIIKALGYDPKTVKQSKFYRPGAFSKLVTEPGSKVSQATSGPLFAAAKGAASTFAGLSQIGLRLGSKVGLNSDADVQMMEAAKKFMDVEYERSHTQLGREKATGVSKGVLGASEFAGETLPTLAVGGPGLQGAKILSKQGAKQLGKIALAGGATALTQPVDMQPGETTAEFLSRKATQFGVGAAAAPVFQAGIERGVVPAAKYVARNNPLARAFGKKATRQAAIERSEAIRTSTQSAAFPEGVEPSLAESMRNPSLGAAENATEYIPFSGRKAQLEKGNTALRAKLQELAGAEKEGLGLTGAGPEIAESAKRKLATAKESFNEPYKFVRDVVGDTAPVRENTIRAYEEAIGKEIGISGKNSPEVKALQNARDSFASGDTGRNFSDLEMIQDRIQYDAAHNAQSPDPGVKAIGRYARDISRGIGEDMHATVAKADPTGLSSDIYKATNKAYRKKVRQFDPNQSLDIKGTRKEARAFVAPEGFEGKIPDRVFQNDNPDMAKYTYEALDEKGRKAIRAEILRRTLEAGDDSKIFSPNKAATSLDKHENFIKEFFDPKEQKQLAGFKNALRDLERSGQYLEKLGTGKFAEQMKHVTAPVTAVGTSVAAGSAVPLVVGTSAIPLARIYNKLSGSKAGKEWLLGMAKVKPNSLLMKTMMKQLPKLVGTEIGEPEKKEESE